MNDKLKNYTATPDPEVWEKIEKSVRRRAMRRHVWTGVAGAAIVALAIVGVVFWPTDKSDISAQSALPDVAQAMPRENVAEVSMPQDNPVAQMTTSQAKTVGTETTNSERLNVAVPSTILPVSQAEVKAESSQSAIVSQAAQNAATSAVVPVVAQVVEPVVSEPQPTTGSVTETAKPTESMSKSSTGSGLDDSILWLPNIFVPSSDDAEINVFRARLNHPGDVLSNYRITIYNRAGNQVFMSNDINNGWDGTYRGREMPQSAYVYVIYFTDKDGFRHQRKGTVTLVR